MAGWFNSFRWQGVDRVYALPILRHRVEISSDPKRIAWFARGRYTRSATLMALLSAFHLSRNSIVVSTDAHAARLRPRLLRSLPIAQDFAAIARELIDRAFSAERFAPGQHTIPLADTLVRDLYLTLLRSLLGVEVHAPLRARIAATDFRPSWRPLRLEALLYALPLPGWAMRFACRVVDLAWFRDARRMRQAATALEEMIEQHSTPVAGSWMAVLLAERQGGRLTEQQFRGELTATLVSSYALSSALISCLLCLANTPYYLGRIRRDPDFADCYVAEVLRLYPPFHQFGYQEHDDARRLEPATSDFLISALFLHRNADCWDLPNHFWPERFAQPGARDRHQYLPFGMGARICPGRQFAVRLLKAVVTYLCDKRCPIALVPGTGLPTARVNQLVSFPVDDRLTFVRLGDR